MEDRFTVRSSHGSFIVDGLSGEVIEFQENSTDEETLANYRSIRLFDTAEYLDYWGKEHIKDGDEIDILNLGYYYGSPMKYEPPAMDWRKEIKEQLQLP